MTVKAWLEGHQFDLQDLAELLADGDVRVVHDPDENAYYLTALEIDNPPEANRFDKAAQHLIVRINGLGRARSADFQPVKLAGRYTSPTGTHIHVGAAAGEIRFRGHAAGVVTTSDGKIVPNPPSPWPARFALAGTNSAVDEALEIVGRSEPLGWHDLFKVHEIICRSVEPTTIVNLGWTTSNRDSTFTGSANNPAISGSGARHARPPKGSQPKRKMSISEGRQYVRDLVAKWLDYLR